MNNYQFTPQAVADLFDIWSFIAQDNPAAADRVEEAVFRACDFLADSPLGSFTALSLVSTTEYNKSVRKFTTTHVKPIASKKQVPRLALAAQARFELHSG